MIQTHLTVEGGEQWLSWAYGRERALRALGTPYMTRRWDMGDGTTVTVRITPDASYIELRGTSGGAYRCLPHSELHTQGVLYTPEGRKVDPYAVVTMKSDDKPPSAKVEERQKIETGDTDWRGKINGKDVVISWMGFGGVRYGVVPATSFPGYVGLWYVGKFLSTRVLIPGKGKSDANVLGACIHVESKRIVFATNGLSTNAQSLFLFSRPMNAPATAEWELAGFLNSGALTPDGGKLGFLSPVYFDPKGEKFATILRRADGTRGGVYKVPTSVYPYEYEYRESGRKYTGSVVSQNGKLTAAGGAGSSATQVNTFLIDPTATTVGTSTLETVMSGSVSYRTWTPIGLDKHSYSETSYDYEVKMLVDTHPFARSTYANIDVVELLGVDYDSVTGAEIDITVTQTVTHFGEGASYSRTIIPWGGGSTTSNYSSFTETRNGYHAYDISEAQAAAAEGQAREAALFDLILYNGQSRHEDRNQAIYKFGADVVATVKGVDDFRTVVESSTSRNQVDPGSLLPGETCVINGHFKYTAIHWLAMDARTGTAIFFKSDGVQTDPDLWNRYARTVGLNIQSRVAPRTVDTPTKVGIGGPTFSYLWGLAQGDDVVNKYEFPAYAITTSLDVKNCFATRDNKGYIISIDQHKVHKYLKDLLLVGRGHYVEIEPYKITPAMQAPVNKSSVAGLFDKFELVKEPEFGVAPITVF